MADVRVEGTWIDGYGGDPTKMDVAALTIVGQLGKVNTLSSTAGTKFYQVVRHSTTDAGTSGAGATAYWADRSNFVVVAETTAGGGANPDIAGVFLGTAPAKGNYGLIQVAGPCVAKVTDTGTVGQPVVYSAQGVLVLSVATTNANSLRVGVVLTAYTTATGTAVGGVYLQPPFRNGW